ncbi:copper chaperone PCu(A)C [Zavarzinia sp.]|uniref:copper chaperone PCu(A)C n=1 Tax=Zavarzinia sp. TaxID=2027920 RepID=UPI003561362E
MIGKHVLFPLALMLAPAPATAREIQAGDLVVDRAWIAAPATGEAAAYLTLFGAKGDDRLIGAETPAAARCELRHEAAGGGAKPVDEIEVASQETVILAPGGYRIALVDLVHPLADGAKVPVTLLFEKAGRVTVDFAVTQAAR